ncbi:hypothetical protein POX_a00400 [Penicillium oxalicum]|uniref:hypothetical protein n=1 Tax=Penicillium oxalicum TaxID=69781 RepID=UPI0020B73900|nr:hypothetical protein POX_a00400 [Penicillium oxalicum]KAI2793813.1 hypothetical protein POX_a00400 [Penicillium oxalicum]
MDKRCDVHVYGTSSVPLVTSSDRDGPMPHRHQHYDADLADRLLGDSRARLSSSLCPSVQFGVLRPSGNLKIVRPAFDHFQPLLSKECLPQPEVCVLARIAGDEGGATQMADSIRRAWAFGPLEFGTRIGGRNHTHIHHTGCFHHYTSSSGRMGLMGSGGMLLQIPRAKPGQLK